MLGFSLSSRIKDAAEQLSEATAPFAPPAGAPPPEGGPPMGGAPPMGMPPMGGPSMGMPPPMGMPRPPGLPPGMPPPGMPRSPTMPPQGPAPSPLQGLPSFKSPPLAAFLQGPKGQLAQTSKPVGFARGGLAMAKGGAWTRKEGQNPEGGLNAKGRASLKAQGQNIKPPVTAKQAAKSPTSAARRKSFCARMTGMPGPMQDEKGRPTRKALSLRKWECR